MPTVAFGHHLDCNLLLLINIKHAISKSLPISAVSPPEMIDISRFNSHADTIVLYLSLT